MVKRLIILVVLWGVVQFSFSQSVEFGKVSMEELKEKAYAKDSSANAAVLYKYRKTYFASNVSSFSLITEVHERIKIYNKDGFDKATISLTLYKSRGTKENIGKLKAYTYNLEDGRIKKTELEKDQIYKSEYSYNYNEVRFTMPNVKEGSVLDIKYKITSPFYFNIDEFRFQYDIPVKKLEAELRTPKVANFNPKHKGYIDFYPQRTRVRDVRMNMPADVLKYTLEDVPAMKEESFVNNIDNYRAGVTFELTSIIIPGNAPQYYSKTWGDVAKMIGNTDDYKNELDKTNSFDDSLDELIANETNNMGKMKAIFKHVKENIKWNGVDGKYFQKGIRKALKERKGNAADINLTMVAMLRYAGIDANPLVISTRDNLVPFFPTVDRLNYVIAYAVMDGEQYFLDATDEFSDINMLPLKDYNWKGILVDNNKMVWSNVGIKEPTFGVSQYIINASIDEEG
ncbi:MAG: transglutaminase domain-containing protein, partial [Bacteroidota bacterium]